MFGVKIEDGTGSFLAFPDRKPSLQNDWDDQNGIDIDLAAPRFSAREFRLKCVLVADTSVDFWDRYNGLFTELSGTGTHELQIEELDKTYHLYYKKQENLRKLTDLKTALTKGVAFDLVFGETDPNANIEHVYLADDQDRFLTA